MNKSSIFIIIFMACFMTANPSNVMAGPNSQAGCALDLNPETQNYSVHVSDVDVESKIKAKTGDIVTVAMVAQGVVDLDTYQVEINYDPEVLEFLRTPVPDSRDFLESKGGTGMGFQAVQTGGGVINISNALVGNDPDQAPEGSGSLAAVQFKVLKAQPTRLELRNVYFLDSAQETDSVSLLSDAEIN